MYDCIIDNAIANSIYKQTTLPLMDYVDFMKESSSLTQMSRLENLQEKAIKTYIYIYI